MSLIEWFITAAIAAIVGLVVYAGLNPGDAITLRAADWSCERSETRTHLQPMPTGKSVILLPMATSECVLYARRK